MPMPVRSSRRSVADGATFGISFAPAIRTNAPIGTLIRKIMRQPLPNRSASISRPATIGPRTADRPETGPRIAHALPISFGGKMSRIRPKTCGSMIAPSTPCSARKPISDLG